VCFNSDLVFRSTFLPLPSWSSDSLPRRSLFVDVLDFEAGFLVWLAFVLDGENHNFVALEAEALFLGHLKDQLDELVFVLLCKEKQSGSLFDLLR
jgi:hypothetical protein